MGFSFMLTSSVMHPLNHIARIIMVDSLNNYTGFIFGWHSYIADIYGDFNCSQTDTSVYLAEG